MKYLFCTHGNSGSLGPSIAIAKELARRGHEVAFVSEPSAASWLSREGLTYIPTSSHRPSGFSARLWADTDRAILQCAYIQDAVREFGPEVLVGHQLTLGSYIMSEVIGVPLAVIGLAAWMYPTRSGSGLWLIRDESAWRHAEFIARLNEVRQRLTMPPLEADFETPIQGNVFFLRSVPALERNVADLPSRVHFIGAAIEPLPMLAPDLERWLRDCEGRQCLYVQEGRTFDCPRFLDLVIETFADTPVRVVIDFANIDGGLPRRWPSNFFAKDGICGSAVLDHCDTVLTTGHSTAVLSAICHGVPMLLFPNGSGTTDIAARCLAAGVAIVSDAASITQAQLRQNVEALCRHLCFHEAADKLQREFAAYNAPSIAGDLLEELGSTRMAVLRKPCD